MFSAVSNVLPIHIRHELPSTGAPADANRPATTTAAVETPRAATAAERRADAGSDPSKDRETKRRGEGSGEEPNLSKEDLAKIRKLKARDAEVRAHEQAHAAAGGSHTGAPSFKYERGPDGRRYAVAGHVGVDTGKVSGDPQATVQKMRQIQRAALAPAEPSAQDRKVAAQAAAKAASAQRELQTEQKERTEGTESAEESAEESPVERSTGSQEVTAANPTTGSDQVPGSAAETVFQAQKSENAYRSGAAERPEPPELKLLACKNCGGAHAP